MAIRRWPWGRIVATVVAAVVLWLTVPSFFCSADLYRRADRAKVAELVRMKVDLSKPGTYSAKFTHDFPPAHGNCVQILTEANPRSFEEAESLVAGLHGRLVITPPGDAAPYEPEFGPNGFGATRLDDGKFVPAMMFHCGDQGEYKLKMIVDRGAPQLAGVAQTIVVRYVICGMEYMVAQIAWLIGLVGCLAAGTLLFVVAAVTVAKRRKAESRHDAIDTSAVQ
jgi:hypothetical protein